MKKIDFEELKQLQCDILEEVHSFCCKSNIRYFLAYGTCIGAIRHGGYIPWDDDIDIGMPRPDYERFIHEFNGSSSHLYVISPELNWNYYAPYANVCDNRTLLIEENNGHNGIEVGVKIDVFPFDGIPSTLKEYHKEKKVMKILWEMLYYKRVNLKNLWKKKKKRFFKCIFMKLLLSWCSYSGIQKIIHKLATSYPYETSEYAIDVIMPWKKDVMCEKNVFDEVVNVPFEGINVSIMKDYDRYLSLRYGDYMQLPPEQERVPHHGFTAYWKD